MRIRCLSSRLLLVAVMLGAFTPLLSAGVYSDVVSYGDSLSDNGNLFAFDHGIYPPPPYWMGRMSNGPVAVEDVAQSLGVPLLDFAWIGATTGVGNIVDNGNQTTLGTFQLPGMLTQFEATSNQVSPNSLVIVWGGANDFLSNGFSQATAQLAVTDILTIVAQLRGMGVMHIAVPGLPDLGLTPEFYGNANATLLSIYFNQLLLAGLPQGTTYINTFALLHTIVADPSAYGLTDVTDPCFNGVTVCSNPDQYLFWDDFHPTQVGHAITAQYILAEIPEPSTLLLLGGGLVTLTGVVRKKMAAAIK